MRCPNCGSSTGATPSCSQCGYHIEVTDSFPVWEEQRWDIVARPDRAYYDQLEPGGMEFPDTVQSRRFPLQGDYLRIGRRSASKGIVPEIDLSGTLEDLGVSHRHVVLMRQPGGDWALVDEGSTNGTFLNGSHDPVPANQPVPLRDGDRIYLGAWTSLAVERSDSSGPPGPDEDAPSRDTRTVARGRLGLEVDLLGPLCLTVAGATEVIGAPKARAVLAVLALRIGASVAAGDLEWALWGDREPRTANKALQGYISTLRRALPDGTIETTPGGYRLLGPKDVVDVFRFERRSTRGRELLASGHPGSAVAEIGRALALWRGDPLADLSDGPVGSTEISRLFELKATAEEDLVDGRLALGDHLGVLPDAQAAVEADPLRQRRWAQLMLALYRSGRQVEALRAFQRVREILAEEYGVEPSADILALERAIVLDDPELRWTVPTQAAPPHRPEAIGSEDG
jgi:DNA-binding SARP family transcriptional activator